MIDINLNKKPSVYKPAVLRFFPYFSRLPPERFIFSPAKLSIP